MNFGTVVKGAIPVVIGVIVAGLILNALRDMDWAQKAISGFDA